MTIIHVKAHIKGQDDPFAPVIDARRPRYCRKWGIELVGTDDPRLAAPIPAPANGSASQSQADFVEQAIGLAQMHGVV